MLASPTHKTLRALGLAAVAVPCATLFAPRTVDAQVREVVSKEVSVGRASAELRLEFADGGELEIAFGDGTVELDGRSVGSYQPGDALDAAWRALLGQAVALDDGPLAEALSDWAPPSDLSGDAASLASRLDRAIEAAMRSADAQADVGAGPSSPGDAASLLRYLLGSGSRLRGLERALADVGPGARVYLSEDVTVGAEEVVDADLIVIDGDARIEGTVDGDVVVVGGSLRVVEGSTISGSVSLVDAELLENEGSVSDGVVDVETAELDNNGDIRTEIQTQIRNQIRSEVIDDVRRELRNEMRGRDGGSSLLSPFRPIIRGVGGVLENLVAIFVLALIAAGTIAFGGEKVDVIAETAKRSPGRSAAVGMAASVLLIPIWLLGFIALIVSIIGIPVAVAWLPLFPLAACAAGIVGYLAVARNTGEWLADSDYPWTHWIRKSNSLVTTVGGLAGLMVLFVAANVVSMAPFLGVVTGLLAAAGFVVTMLAVEIGLGAVILTRGGRRREQWSTYTADEAWDAAMKVDVDVGSGTEEGNDA